MCAPGSQDPGDTELDHAMGMPLADPQPIHEHHVNFVHCKEKLVQCHIPASEPIHCEAKPDSWLDRALPLAAASIFRLRRIHCCDNDLAISLARSASEHICDCTKSRCSRNTPGSRHSWPMMTLPVAFLAGHVPGLRYPSHATVVSVSAATRLARMTRIIARIHRGSLHCFATPQREGRAGARVRAS